MLSLKNLDLETNLIWDTFVCKELNIWFFTAKHFFQAMLQIFPDSSCHFIAVEACDMIFFENFQGIRLTKPKNYKYSSNKPDALNLEYFFMHVAIIVC